MKFLSQKLLVIGLFAISMGFLEAIVVVYLRELFYPSGFQFPLISLPLKFYNVEIVRETTTLIMLVCIGLLAGKTINSKFGWFLFVFGIWDIFYYIGLKLSLDWPASIMTWDILFLIPITWIGPVLAPVICSVTMILIAFLIIFFEYKGYTISFGKYTWTLFGFGAVIIFFSFIENYFMLLYFDGFFNIFNNDFNQVELENTIANFIPVKFNWLLFAIGEFFILGGVFHLIRNYLKHHHARFELKK